MPAISRNVVALLFVFLLLAACEESTYDTSSAQAYEASYWSVTGTRDHEIGLAMGLVAAARFGLEKPENLSALDFQDRLEALPGDPEARRFELGRLALEAALERVKAETGKADAEPMEVGFRLIPDAMAGKTADQFIAEGDKAFAALESALPKLLRKVGDANEGDLRKTLAKVEKSRNALQAELAKLRQDLERSERLMPKIVFSCCRLQKPATGRALFFLTIENRTAKAVKSIAFNALAEANDAPAAEISHAFSPPVEAKGRFDKPVEGSAFHSMGSEEKFASAKKEIVRVRFDDGQSIRPPEKVRADIEETKKRIQGLEKRVRIIRSGLEGSR